MLQKMEYVRLIDRLTGLERVAARPPAWCSLEFCVEQMKHSSSSPNCVLTVVCVRNSVRKGVTERRALETHAHRIG